MCSLYERITELCRLKGVTGSRMCIELGISKSTLSDMKAGRTKGISTSTAQKIASYLNVSVGYLLGGEEMEKVQKNNDILSDIVIKAQRDKQFYADLQAFYQMDDEKRKAFIALIK